MTDEQPWRSLTEAAGLLVQVPADLLAGHDRAADHGSAEALADLVAEVAELRTDLARAEAGRDAAEAIRRAEVTALRELADRLTAELMAARQPWWGRWFGSA